MLKCTDQGLPARIDQASYSITHCKHSYSNRRSKRIIADFRKSHTGWGKPAHSTKPKYAVAAAASTNKASSTAAQTHGEANLTLYGLLGVPTSAALADIKLAYRKLARVCHPDVNKSKDAQQKFQLISEAYEVLCDSALRHKYDMSGMPGLDVTHFRALHRYFGGSIKVGERGGDVYTVVGLQLVEAVTGVERSVTVGVRGTCPDCEGRGLAAGALAPSCEVCHGLGEILKSRWNGGGVKSMQLGVCPACGGKGMGAVAHCNRCAGEGRSHVKRHVRVQVPAGVEAGNVLRVQGMGDAGRYGGEAGDLLIKFHVHPGDNLVREGQDLRSELCLSVYDALLGGAVSVQTARGEMLLDVPAGTQHGDVLMLKHAGVAKARAGITERGHHLFTVQLQVPDGSVLSSAERQMLQRLGQAYSQGGAVPPAWVGD